MKYTTLFLWIGLILWLGFGACQSESITIDYSGPVSEWHGYGGDWRSERYSPLTQVSPENVRHLKKAWVYHTGDVSYHGDTIPSSTAFEATAILVNNTLYMPSPFNRVFALDPETGEEKWIYDPEISLKGFYANQLVCRGLAYWEGKDCPDAECPKRLFMGTNDGRLISIDANSGKAISSFGDQGSVNLKEGVGTERYWGEYQVTSPPAVAGDVVVVGSAIADNSRVTAPSGVIRAFDIHSGKQVWAWDLMPPQDSLPDSLHSDAGYILGTPNVWAPMSVDSARDLIFIPTGNPIPDYYGGHRGNLDYYGSSIVALRASTGEVVWHFQTVHHDLWDFDVPAQPVLTRVYKDGEWVPVVIQTTKMGLLFTLHRETGEPVFPVEERPVPQTDVPGEYTSPTQPYPVKPDPLIPHDMDKSKLFKVLGYDGDCAEILAQIHYEGAYTPPKLNHETLMYPGNAGGSNWGGIAVHPDRQILIANVMDLAWTVSLFPSEDFDSLRKNNPGMVEFAPQRGTPYGMRRRMLLSSLGTPCTPPPWGTLQAIDLSTGEHMWTRAFGTLKEISPIPVNMEVGVPNLGGPLVTASGLVFIGATADKMFRAYDIGTGDVLWEDELPAGGQAGPMSYRIRPDGKQYIVIAAGGHGRGGTVLGDAIVAYSLE